MNSRFNSLFNCENLMVPDTNDSFTVYTFLMNKMNKIAGGEY